MRCFVVVASGCNSCHLVPTNNLLPISDFRCENCELCMQIENGEPVNMVHRLERMRIEISADGKNHCVSFYFFGSSFSFFAHSFSGTPLIWDSYACAPFLHMISHKPTNDSVVGLFVCTNGGCFRARPRPRG